MATTTIISPGSRGGYVLTSDVSEIRATSSAASVEVSLSCYPTEHAPSETFFSTTVEPFGSEVVIYNVGQLVEEYFRAHDIVCRSVTITIGDASVLVRFLYCEFLMPEAFVPSSDLLVASTAQRVRQSSTVAVAAIAKPDTPFVIKAVVHKPDSDELAVAEDTIELDEQGPVIRYFDVSDIVKKALADVGDDGKPVIRDVLYFTVNYAGMQKVCYIVPAPAYLTFQFRNIFNVLEFIDVVGSMTTKTEVSRESAVCSGRLRQYDRLVTRTYEVQTEPLTAEEVTMYEQFLSSHTIRMTLEGYEENVIITDHTCEPSTDDESLTTVKFTWRFADSRPRLFGSPVNGIMPPHRMIFDNTFSPEYE